MNEHNAINPMTGETKYIGIREKLPDGYIWISGLTDSEWLRIIRNTRAALRAENAKLREALELIASGDGVYGQQAGEYKTIARRVLESNV